MNPQFWMICSLEWSQTQFLLQCNQLFHDGLIFFFHYLLLLERMFGWALFPPHVRFSLLYLEWSLNLSTDKKPNAVCLFANLGCSYSEVFLRKCFLKICSNFAGEHPCRSVNSIKLLCKFIEIALRHWCSAVNLLHIFRAPFPRNISGWLLLKLLFHFIKSEVQLLFSLVLLFVEMHK